MAPRSSAQIETTSKPEQREGNQQQAVVYRDHFDSASAYLFAFAIRLPSFGTLTSTSQEIFQGSRFFRLYMVAGTTVGLFLPLAYVLGGFARGDQHAVRSATPHLFLLSFQILTENIFSGLSLFSPPIRALVPVYTVPEDLCLD
ncbi:hypothetical protein HAX54_049962 [Datura stramonium]|uniref:DUF7733 domain-containing protein n=1 Tax=Datura stramonium TaxID=4076 RepID=A0ABS8WKX4_DATST|nr:hypothetical protein [Datura stramonium]